MSSDPPAAAVEESSVEESHWELEHQALVSWRDAFFSTIAPNERGRSGSDAVRLIVGILTTMLIMVAYSMDPSIQKWWVNFALPPPLGVDWFLTTLFLLGTAGAALLLVVFALFVRRKDLTLDLLSSFGLGLGLSYLLQFVFGVSSGQAKDPVFAHVNVGFPVPILVAVMAMGIVGRPYFARGVRRFILGAIGISLIGAMTTGRALPLALAGSFAVAWVAASIVRLALGRPHVGTSGAAVRDALAPMGLDVVRFSPHPLQPTRAAHHVAEWGVERTFVTTSDRITHRVSIYGRDARDAEILTSLWRMISVRESGVAPFIGRQQQAEHEALAIATIYQASHGASPLLDGVTATSVTHDVLVVATSPAGVTLRERLETGPLTANELRSICELIFAIHSARVSLGTIDLDHLGLSPDGAAIIDDTLHADLNATPSALNQDVASLLALLGLLSDPASAVALVMDVFGRAQVESTLAFLQKPALNPTLRQEIKPDHDLLADLRAEGAKATGVEEPKLAQLRRVSGTTLVLTAGTIIGGWALLGVFINVAASISTLKGANWAWVAVTFVLAQLCFPSLALSTLGSVTGKLPYGRLVALEVADSFAGLAAGTAAVLAARVRFFQKEGYDTTVAVSSGILISMVSWLVKGALFLIALPFAWHNIHLTTSPTDGGSDGKLVTFALIAVLVISIVATVAFAVPKWRKLVEAKLRPKLSEVKDQLRSLMAEPRKLVEIFGGSIMAQLLVAMALGTSLHAFDAHLPIATLLVVLTIGSMLGGMSPVPGGIGVVEAGMILGLTAAGIPEPIAVSAVFVQRLFTSYLPPIWGYVTLLWLRRHDYL